MKAHNTLLLNNYFLIEREGVDNTERHYREEKTRTSITKDITVLIRNNNG